MMTKIFLTIKSKKMALFLLVWLLTFSLGMIYFPPDKVQSFAGWGMVLSFSLLSISLFVCSLARLRTFLGKGITGPVPGLRESKGIRLPGQEVTARLKAVLTARGFCVNITETGLIAGKMNRGGLLGSVIFHTGLVVILLGFAINALWGFHGNAFIPERTMIKVPDEVYIYKKGWFHVAPPPFFAGLEKFTHINEPASSSQPVGDLYFQDFSGVSRQQVKINYPALFNTVYWRFKNWGYSIHLNIDDNGIQVVNDFVNIATHNGTSFYDTIPVNEKLKIDIRFFPDYIEVSKGVYGSRSPFPDKPAAYLIFISGNKKIAEGFVTLNESKKIGTMNVHFQGFRYWELFDVGSDPGKQVIWAGGLMIVAGLLFRLFLVTKKAAFRFEPSPDAHVILHWGTWAGFGKAVFAAEIREIIEQLGEMDVDNS